MAVFQVREVRAKIPASGLFVSCDDYLFFSQSRKYLKCRNMLY